MRRKRRIRPGKALGFMPRPSDIVRLLDGVKVDANGCWLWGGCVDGDGYGSIKIRGVRYYVHRVSFALFCGDVADGMDVDHTCRCRQCVNPEHLRELTRSNHATVTNRRRWSRSTETCSAPF